LLEHAADDQQHANEGHHVRRGTRRAEERQAVGEHIGAHSSCQNKESETGEGAHRPILA
jgi:hypothetical protein